MKVRRRILFAVILASVLVLVPSLAQADGASGVATYRLYNRYSGEHFYTVRLSERDSLVKAGWQSEGVCWSTPESSSTPVYRLYNRYNGEHLYTTSELEYETLGSIGWSREGVAFYSSSEEEGTAVYRLFNPYETTGTHLYTTSAAEVESLLGLGWRRDGVCWYALGTPIMGASRLTAEQMAAYYVAQVGESTYPSSVYAEKGAPTIDDFCRILVDEAETEGVRADVAFMQAMKETGWLRFGGAVKVEQCNFCGLGAVNSSPTSAASFADVRTGVRAQIQHLKAYASTEQLVNDCVDPRFSLVTRGCAPTLEQLNGRWAVPGNGYGESIAAMIDAAVKYTQGQ